MTKREIRLEGGAPWGFRMNGGADSGHPLRISRVNPGSKAAQQGVREGDVISAINGTATRLLSNGDSHALLKTAGTTLTLGLNQDTSGSPKRRSRDLSKREAVGGSHEPNRAQNERVTESQTKTTTVEASIASTSSTAQPNKQGKKSKLCRQPSEDESTEKRELCASGETEIYIESNGCQSPEDSGNKISSSRARRLRKSRANHKRKEVVSDETIRDTSECTSPDDSTLTRQDQSEYESKTENADKDPPSGACATTPAPALSAGDEEAGKFTADSLVQNVLEGSNPTSGKSSLRKDKKQDRTRTEKTNHRSPDESATKSTRLDQNNSDHDPTKSINESENTENKDPSPSKFHHNASAKVDDEKLRNINVDNESKKKKKGAKTKKGTAESQNKTRLEENHQTAVVESRSVRAVETVIVTTTTSHKSIESTADSSTDITVDEVISDPKGQVTERKDVTEEKKTSKRTSVDVKSTEAKVDVDTKLVKSDIQMVSRDSTDTTSKTSLADGGEKKKKKKKGKVRDCAEDEVELSEIAASKPCSPVEVVVDPPTPTLATENTFFGPDWETAAELDAPAAAPSPTEEDLPQEYLVHFPDNDLRAEVNSLVLVEDCVDDYGLTINDIRSPLIPPEEEERLRCFLETLDLTKPEEYDDSSSCKSSDSATGNSEPEACRTKEEVVVYGHCKSRCSAEPCYIPPPHRHYLDVITEENSDLSDCDRRSEGDRPWENSEAIRRNNEVEAIPDDWADSDHEAEYYSEEEGGIKSWSEGTTLDEAEGVEIVYLDSDNSDDTVVCEKDVSLVNKPQLVVVHTKELCDVLKVKNVEGEFNGTKPEINDNVTNTNGQTDAFKANRCRGNDEGMKPESIASVKPARTTIGSDKETGPLNGEKNNNSTSVNKNAFQDTNNEDKREKFGLVTCVSREINVHTLDTLDLIKVGAINHVDNPRPVKESGKTESHYGTVRSEDVVRTNTEKPHGDDVFEISSHCHPKPPLPTGDLRPETHNGDEKLMPVAQEKLDVTSTPVISRQNSSSSGTGTTQSTSRYVCSSPLSSENEDRLDKKNVADSVEDRKTPESLRELSAKKVISLPNGIKVLEEIGIIQFKCSNSQTEFENDIVDAKKRNSFDFSPHNRSRTSSTLPGSPDGTRPTSRPLSFASTAPPNDSYSRRSSSILLFTPPPSDINSPPYSLPPDQERWIGMPTSDDRLLCFSPSQSKCRSVPPSPKEAAGLLDLHKKFIERRGYHEDKAREASQSLQSPDLIRLECYNEQRRPQDYTPELLVEAANLLALKEYRQSRFKENSSPEVRDASNNRSTFKIKSSEEPKGNEKIRREFSDIDKIISDITNVSFCSVSPVKPENGQKIEESKRYGAVLEEEVGKRTLENVFTEKKETEWRGGEAEQGDGSRLLALIQSQNDQPAKRRGPISPPTADLCNPPCGGASENPGAGRSADFASGLAKMSLETGELENRRVFDADRYRISKQGDIAVMLNGEGGRPERPRSLPPGGAGSCGELFRQRMYEEYMDKVAERCERRQQKVIKLSDRPASMVVSREEEIRDFFASTSASDVHKLEDEFMEKVRERMSKLGIPSEEEDASRRPEEELPKHLQEFVQLAAAESPDHGVWSPSQTPEAQRKVFDFSSAELEKEKQEDEKDKKDGSPTPLVWTPRTAPPSPPADRKSYRPINFESPPPVRKHIQPVREETPKPPTSLPLAPCDWSQQQSRTTRTVESQSIETQRRLTSSQSADSSLAISSEINLPRAPNPTITLLQKAREGQLPRGAHYLDEEETASTITADDRKPHIDPNEIIYSVRREYNSESEDKRAKKIVDLGPRKFEGIGPTTREGIPIVLRSEVKDANQQRWYKRMYDSLHRAEKDSQYPYSTGGGYLSEPDRLGTDYDSDVTTSKYATLDRRRIRNKENDFTTSTMPRSKYMSNSVKHAVDVYKNQPGRIEDYVPGHSSISEKEAKQWWDEVLDIFDEQFEQSQKASRPPTTPNTGKPFMTYALKESGYESDSTLVFKRRDENLQNQLAMSPAEQKVAYKTIQKGGDVPLHGLRKPAPERPKEPISGGAIPVPERDFQSKQQRPESPHRYVESEVTIHYRSPVRSEAKEAWSEEELAQRQAEAMRRIYQEERRRKYLQELQDMYSRRHTDNFIPSQKSPIPLNRYDDFLNDLGPTKNRDRTPEPKLVARALYNFVGQSSRELSFRRGDIIFVRRQIDKNWYEGEHNAMIGLFPFNYVEIIPYDGIRTAPKRPSEGQARAKFNFQAQTHLELSLVKGELVVLTRRVDENWFEGRIGNRKGIFPVSYVDVLVEPGDRAASPIRPTTPALSSNKPVASPAAHSMMLNGAKNSLSHHHYTPPPPVSYTSLSRPTKTTKQDLAPVNQALHIDTQSEPVPYRALYNYKPQNDDELELNEGDTVYVMEKCDDGWYVGSSQRTGCFGTFPGNYVQRLPRGAAGSCITEDSILHQRDSHQACF